MDLDLRGLMGDAEVCGTEEGDLKVDQQDNIRFLLRPLKGNVVQRRLVVTWPNCSSCLFSCQEDVLVSLLVKVFCLTVSLAVIRIFYELSITNTRSYSCGGPTSFSCYPTWVSQFFHLKWEGILFLAVLGAVFAIRVLMKMQRRQEVTVSSGLVQHV